jgi:hypothetical protein
MSLLPERLATIMHQQKEKTEKKVVAVSREEDLECQGL